IAELSAGARNNQPEQQASYNQEQKQHKWFEGGFGSHVWNVSLKVWNCWWKAVSNTNRSTCRHIRATAMTQNQREHQPEDAVASGQRLHRLCVPGFGGRIRFQVLLVSVAQQACQLLTKMLNALILLQLSQCLISFLHPAAAGQFKVHLFVRGKRHTFSLCLLANSVFEKVN